MKASQWALAVTALVTAYPLICHADLSNRTYVQAFFAYRRDECPTASRLLKAYERRDSAYLSAHPATKRAIDNALLYCNQESDSQHGQFNRHGRERVFVYGPRGWELVPRSSGHNFHNVGGHGVGGSAGFSAEQKNAITPRPILPVPNQP